MTRPAAPVREAVLEALAGDAVRAPTAPRGRRPSPGALEGAAGDRGRSRDRRAAGAPPADEPDLDRCSGIGQTLDLALLVFAVAWIVLWVLLRPPVGSIDVPVLGPIPVPFVLLAVGLITGFVLARLLALHAGFVGRRWAGRLAARLRTQVDAAVTDEAFAAVDRLEVARRALWIAAREAETAGRLRRPPVSPARLPVTSPPWDTGADATR